jgi:hypothetical protein
MSDAGITASTGTLNTALNVFTGARTLGNYNPATDTDLGLFIGTSPTPETGAGTTVGSILDYIKENGNGTDGDSYTIVIGADEDLAPWTLGGSGSGSTTVFNGKTGITLTLKGKEIERLICLNAVGILFTVNSGITLVLDEHITLRGRADNNSTLVLLGSSGTLKMEAGSKISGNTNSSTTYGGGVFVNGGTFTMSGGEISGNSSSSSASASSGGGGVHVFNGTFTMSGGEISGNSYTSGSGGGGGVRVSGGIFNMSGGEISGNTASYTSGSGGGGGVYVSGGAFNMSGTAKISGNTAPLYDGGGVRIIGGTFNMNAGEISGNTANYVGGVYAAGGTFAMSAGVISGNTAYNSGGGMIVNSSGTFTMSGTAEISGNTAPYGGGVRLEENGTFTISGAARINLNNPVYFTTTSSFITIGSGGFTGTDPVALVEPAANIGFIGKPALKWGAGETEPLPVNRFEFSSGWAANSDGTLDVNALVLDAPGEAAAAYLSRGQVHFYRFTPDWAANYTITHTRPSGIYAAAGWADGSGTLVTSTSTSGTSSTSTAFNATKPDLDIIIMVYNGSGAYTVRYNKQ